MCGKNSQNCLSKVRLFPPNVRTAVDIKCAGFTAYLSALVRPTHNLTSKVNVHNSNTYNVSHERSYLKLPTFSQFSPEFLNIVFIVTRPIPSHIF